MSRFDVEGFDAARYITDHNDEIYESDDVQAEYPLYSQRSLDSEPAFGAHSASQPVGYAMPSYGQASAYQRQSPRHSTTGPPGPNRSAPGSMVYYYDPATQTYSAVPAPTSLSSSVRAGAKVMLAPRQAPPASPAAAPPPTQTTSTAPATTAVGVPQPPSQAPATAPAVGEVYVPPVARREVADWAGKNKWVVSSGSACCQSPCVCLGALCCPCCMVGAQRRKLLGSDWSQYRCCAGLCGQRECCSDGSGQCGMCCEALCCCPCALHGNRYMLQKRFGLKQTCCDRCVGYSACCCSHSESCCGWCGGGLCDCWYLCAFPCLLTQQHCQLKVAAATAPTLVAMQ